MKHVCGLHLYTGIWSQTRLDGVTTVEECLTAGIAMSIARVHMTASISDQVPSPVESNHCDLAMGALALGVSNPAALLSNLDGSMLAHVHANKRLLCVNSVVLGRRYTKSRIRNAS